MPSFDVVSKVDKHELQNAIDQANREIDNRFDFKGSDSRFELTQLQDMLVDNRSYGLFFVRKNLCICVWNCFFNIDTAKSRKV